MTSPDHPDVIVIGGGPAGSATATFLAQAGHQVLLLERETFPRFHIGESLMPATYWTFRRLGVLEKLERSPFVRKESVQFFSGDGRPSSPFYFTDADPHASSITWQVDRGSFDRLLLDHAREQGVNVRQPASVTDVLLEDGRAAGVQVGLPGGGREEIRARVVVDASGQNALLASRLGLQEDDPQLRHAAFFTRFRGGTREEGRDGGATLVINTTTERSWFWSIPLPGNLDSIGVVGHIDHLLKGRVRDPQQLFDEELARCPALQLRLAGAEQVMPVQVLRDFSYAARRIAGDGWVLVGDAFGFLDPIYSSGVLLALKGAEFAAGSISAALREDDLSAARLGRHGAEFIAGMEALRRLVYAYYDPMFSFARFVRSHPEARPDLVNLLMGNVYRKPCTGILDVMDARPPGYQPLRLPPPERP